MAGYKYRPVPSLQPKDIARFWKKVDKAPGFGPEGDCWRWIGATTVFGYGTIGIGYKLYSASRISYLIHNSELPDLFVLHKCDNPPCTNPAHLFIGSVGDNAADCATKKRNVRRALHPMSKLTEDQVIEIKRRRASGEKLKSIADDYDVKFQSISKIARGSRWAGDS